MTPSEVEAIWEKVASDRSMMRPPEYGPRSSTVQVVLAPLARLVTRTTVPNGREGWAQVPAGAEYQEAEPVSELEDDEAEALLDPEVDRAGAVVVVVGRASVVVGDGGGAAGEGPVVGGTGGDEVTGLAGETDAMCASGRFDAARGALAAGTPAPDAAVPAGPSAAGAGAIPPSADTAARSAVVRIPPRTPPRTVPAGARPVGPFGPVAATVVPGRREWPMADFKSTSGVTTMVRQSRAGTASRLRPPRSTGSMGPMASGRRVVL